MDAPAASASSTAPNDDGLTAARRDRRARRIALSVVALVVAVGLTGALGVRSGSITRTADQGVTIELVYPRVARPGLAVPWRLLIVSPQGFGEGVRVSLSSAYVSSFDKNDLTPDPGSIEADDDEITYVFDDVPGTRMEMAFDMKVEPGVQWRRTSVLRVELGARKVVDLRFTTWVLP